MTRPGSSARDEERGLRGIMSAILILEAISVLLAIPVISNLGNHQGAGAVTIICVLAAAHIAGCVVIGKRYAVAFIFVLQALLVACWVLSGAIAAIGIVFAVVWGLVVYMRREFRRRVEAGTIPRQ